MKKNFVNTYPLDLLVFRWSTPAWLLATLAVLFYYGAPLSAAVYDGSVVTKSWINTNSELNPYLFTKVISFASGHTKMKTGTGYAQDQVHFFFTCLVFAGTFI
jgi:hypothetical protein